MAQHSVRTALCTAGSAVHALDLAQARKFLKIAADRHIRDTQRIRNLFNRDRSLFLEQLPNLILSLRFNHDESSLFHAHVNSNSNEQIVSESRALKMSAHTAQIITFLRKIPPALVGCSDNLACSRYSLSEIPRC